MGQTESNLGITPGFGGSQRMPRLIGRTKAFEFLILGTQVPAQECLALGLANRLTKDGETLNDARALHARSPSGRRSPHGSSSRPSTRARGADRQGDRHRDPRVPEIAQDRGRVGGHPGVLRQARAELQGAPAGWTWASAAASRSSPAARSLGKADAAALAAEGCPVATRRPRRGGRRRGAAELEAAGGRSRGYACDIRDSAQRSTTGRIERDLVPSTSVNNAGLIYTMASRIGGTRTGSSTSR